MRSEPADQLDRVLVGALALGAAADQRHAQRGARAALPDDLDLGATRLVADGDDDLGDQRAQQLLAVTRGRGLGRPQARQVARDARERLALLGTQRFRAAAFELGELAALALQRGQRQFEPAFERARHEPVLGLAGVELAPRPLGLELGALDGEPLTVQALVVAALELADRFHRSAQPGRGDGLQEGARDRLLEPQAAERLARAVGAVELVGAHARIARHAPVVARIGDLHPPPTTPAAHDALQQRDALTRRPATLAR